MTGKIYVAEITDYPYNNNYFPGYAHTLLVYDPTGNWSDPSAVQIIEGEPAGTFPPSLDVVITDGRTQEVSPTTANLKDITSLLGNDPASSWASLVSYAKTLGTYDSALSEPGIIDYYNTGKYYWPLTPFAANCNVVTNTILSHFGTSLVANLPTGVPLIELPGALTTLGSAPKPSTSPVTAPDITGINSDFYTLPIRPDPIAIDLNGDGIISQTGPESVYFDMQNNGVKDAVSWVGPQDGILAVDSNQNGVIDNASELITSYAQLQSLDTNHDGVIDSQDAIWSSLVVWQDKNQDGISQPDELLSVKNDLFLEEIPTTPAIGGNTAYIQAAKGAVMMQSINFTEDKLNTVADSDVPLNIAVATLPQLRGYGTVQDLWTAMSANSTLLTLAQNLASNTLAGIADNFGSFSQQFDTLLYTWGGVENLNPLGRGTFIDDGRKLDFIENILNTSFTQFGTGNGQNNPQSITAALVETMYADLKEDLMGRFLLQSGAAGFYDTPVSYDPISDTVNFDGAPHLSTDALNALGTAGAASSDPAAFWASIAYIIDATHNGAEITLKGTEHITQNINDDLVGITLSDGAGEGLATLSADEITALNAAVQLSDPNLTWATVEANYESLLPPPQLTLGPNDNNITGTSGDDDILGDIGNDTISGLGGNDTLNGGDGNNSIIGGNGADELIGGSGEDVISAGTGGSLMEGGDGSDVYIYNYGKADYINDIGGAHDVLSITVGPQLQGSGFAPGIERVVGADGNTNDMLITFQYYDASRKLVSTQVTLQDQFNTSMPNSVIEEIDYGSPIFVRNSDGTISFGGGNPDLVTVGTDGNDVLSNLDINFKKVDSNYIYTPTETVRGGAGNDTITISHMHINNRSVVGVGEDGDDLMTGIGDFGGGSVSNYGQLTPYEIELNGGNGNDTMISQSGVVDMEGGFGSDTYIWQSGQANISDFIYSTGTYTGIDTNTTIIDHASVSLSDFTITTGYMNNGYEIGNFLKFTLNGSSTDSINFINNYLGGTGYDLLTFSYQNAPILNLDNYAAWSVGTTGSDTISGQTVFGNGGSDMISGTSGNDTLIGNTGSDTLSSTNGGSDYLNGGDGNDLYIYANPNVDPANPQNPPPAPTSTTIVGGRGSDTLQLNLTAAQYVDAAVLNDISNYQQFIAANLNTSSLNGASFTFNSLGLTASDMESFVVNVDGVQQSLTAPINRPPVAEDDAFSVVSGQTLAGNLFADNGSGADSDPDGNTLSTTAQTITTANGGALSIQANGNFTYTPAAGFTGADNFSYTLSDGFGGTASANVNITVAPKPNRAPVAVDDLIDAQNIGIVSGNVLVDNGHNGFGVDYDLDRDPLSVQAQTLTTVNGGQVVLNANGNFTYHAASGYAGADSFQYTLQDNHGATAAGNVYISNIDGSVSLPPSAENDNIDAASQSSVTGNVLADNGNGADFDPNGLALSTVAETLATANGGTFTLGTDGSFTYTAATGYRGSDTATYTVEDTAGLTATATVNISNIFTNRAPSANNEVSDAQQQGSASGNVLTGNSDPDGDTFSAVTQTLTTANGNAVTINADGSFTLSAAAGFRGTDSFAYADQDAYGAQSNDTVTVNNIFTNRAPVTALETINAANAPTASGNVLANDSDPDSDTLSAVAQTLASANGATVTVASNGAFTYTAATGFRGNDSFSYTAEDAYGATTTGTVDVNNVFTNRAPTANAEAFDAQQAGSISGNVLTGNSDPDGDTFSAVAQTLTTANGNAVTINADGSFTLSAAAGFRGTDSFAYTDQDAYGAQSTGTVMVNNIFTNRAPVTAPEVLDLIGASRGRGNVLFNDSDPDGDALGAVAETFTSANGAAVTIDADGTFTYFAASGFRGNDIITYIAEDAYGAVTSGTLELDNVFTNRAPTANDEVFDARQQGSASGNILNGNSDPDGDTFSAIVQTLTTANGNTVTINADGSFTLQAAAGFRGADSFAYTDEDAYGAQSTGTVTINNLFTNRAPVTALETIDAASASTASGNVLTADTDPDGDALSAVAQTLTTANGGTVAIAANGAFTYTAAAGFRGNDSFSYMAEDAYGAETAGTVILNNVVADRAPVALADSFAAAYGQTISGNLLANDTDPDGDALHVVQSTVTTADGFTVALNANGTFSYTPEAGFLGADSFSYTAADPYGMTSNATVSLNVTAPANAIIGTNGNDSLTGPLFGGADMFGLAGNDTLTEGFFGSDTMLGGTGNDTYLINNASDVVVENAGEGNDLVQSSVSFTLSANVERLVLTGFTNLAGTGGSTAAVITGNSGADILSDGAGTAADTLIGNSSLGMDTFIVNNAADSVTETNNWGLNQSLVQSSASWTLGANINRLTLTGSGITGTLNNGTNTIIDASAHGGDTLVGGTGADDFVLASAGVYNSIDVIRNFSTGHGDKIDISALTPGYIPFFTNLAHFVHAVNAGTDSLLQVDSTGTGNHFQTVATITGVTNINVATYVSNGNLVV